MGMARGTHSERGSACRVLNAKPGGNRELERLRSRWENNFTKDLQEIKECGMDLSGSRLGQGSGTCEQGNEPFVFHKLLRMP